MRQATSLATNTRCSILKAISKKRTVFSVQSKKARSLTSIVRTTVDAPFQIGTINDIFYTNIQIFYCLKISSFLWIFCLEKFIESVGFFIRKTIDRSYKTMLLSICKQQLAPFVNTNRRIEFMILLGLIIVLLHDMFGSKKKRRKLL